MTRRPKRERRGLTTKKPRIVVRGSPAFLTDRARGKWAAGCLPNAAGVSWFLSSKGCGRGRATAAALRWRTPVTIRGRCKFGFYHLVVEILFILLAIRSQMAQSGHSRQRSNSVAIGSEADWCLPAKHFTTTPSSRDTPTRAAAMKCGYFREPAKANLSAQVDKRRQADACIGKAGRGKARGRNSIMGCGH